MLQRLRLYWEQSRGDDRCVLAFLLFPPLLSLSGLFPTTILFWCLGALAGFAGYRRFARPGLRLLLMLGGLAVAGVLLLEHGLLSSSWTMPLSQLLWFCLAVPAGSHFGAVSDG
ncbi:MAG: hypothetical protein KF760_15200 [Candidatus Eremiobacteraeota bacterium]|nr:hypothetical protein [Candidatus Eremiobacteraeota bacterium]MCW5866384.1 hypothetical protein [Candidatus Eremiobacteraeota bacterium]